MRSRTTMFMPKTLMFHYGRLPCYVIFHLFISWMEKGSGDSGGLGVKSRQTSGTEVLFLFRDMGKRREREKGGEDGEKASFLYIMFFNSWLVDTRLGRHCRRTSSLGADRQTAWRGTRCVGRGYQIQRLCLSMTTNGRCKN